MTVWIVADRDGPGIYGAFASEDLAYRYINNTFLIPIRVRPIVHELEVEGEAME